MLPSLEDQLRRDLAALDAQGRRRALPGLASPSRVEVRRTSTQLISFCSNDYLGLACRPELAAAALETARRSGFGAGASRLVAGDLPEHRELEAELAAFLGLPSALLFPTGYQANIGTITALAGPDDLIVADRAIHASLIDGCRLSGAKLAFYPHLALEKAQHHLARLGPRTRRRFLITESLFSMDGDIPPLRDLHTIAAAHDAAWIVDEAHALGVLGPQGAGLCSESTVVPDVLIGTLGKAFGCGGAFVAGSQILRDTLLNRARTFIFTTALPPALAGAALRALAIIRSAEGAALRSRLAGNIARLRQLLGLPEQSEPSPILPIILGSDAAALAASAHLESLGLFVQAIRPPTVREGTARLRLTLSASHDDEHLRRLADALRDELAQALPKRPPRPTFAVSAPDLPPSPAARPHPGLFVAGTDTGVGKTAVATALLTLIVERGLPAVPFKPVETGADPLPNDAQRLRSAAGRMDLSLGTVCPIPLRTPVAPAAAAALEQVPISLPLLLKHFAKAASQPGVLVVESAGGLLSPYAPGLTGADLAEVFQLPVLLVSRNALGTINHTALAIAEIRRRGLPLLGVVLVNTAGPETPDQASNAQLIADVTGVRPLGVLPFLPSPTPATLARNLAASIDLGPVWARILT